MEKTTKSTRADKIYEFFNELYEKQTKYKDNDEVVCINNYIDAETVKDYDSVYEQLEENGGFNTEIIYYSKAIQYLDKKNDSSLEESIRLACGYGYETKSLNSELLASLLYSQKARCNFSDRQSEIDEFFETLEDDEETNDSELKENNEE